MSTVVTYDVICASDLSALIKLVNNALKATPNIELVGGVCNCVDPTIESDKPGHDFFLQAVKVTVYG